METLIHYVYNDLLPQLLIESIDPLEPIQVMSYPQPWVLLGAGNYAAVLYHPDYPEHAVKVYADGKPGLEEEHGVYRLLGDHPSYSTCYYAGEQFLILKRLMGMTVYECLQKGVVIPERAIRDIDLALDYARSVNLRPHDVHAKNVMVHHGRGLIVDVSDFSKQESCRMWDDFKKAYYRLYWPVASHIIFPIPAFMLESVRKGYQLYRRRRRRIRNLPPTGQKL
ncbi:serine/threonine protein kinase [Paenibacillus kandeliae]|uniref:serine/threonine protein kinase n=1 Tax=Paenibacillus kandeliae TaxID=3231269 RepID=UPI003458F178